MHIDYVTGTFHLDGPRLSGRSLVRHLNQEHQVAVIGAIVEPDSKLLDGPNAEFCRVETELAADVVLFEGGWIETHGFTRARLDVLTEFARTGGVVVIADIDRNNADRDRAAFEALGFDWPKPRYAKGVRYLYDEGAREDGYKQRFFTSQMRVSTWLEPALRGIDSLLTWGAVELDPGDAIAATGHPTTKILELDLFVDTGFPWPWASAMSYGKGFIVIIGAQLTGDVYVDACPDNARWISNLLALLTDRAHENKTWGNASVNNSRQGNQAGPAQDLAQLLSVEESESHERKGSFLTPLNQPDTTPEVVIQLKVLATIAALANTNGGHLVIGQHDKGHLLGLDADFSKLNSHNQSRDGFALRLAEFVDLRLSRSWAQLGLRLDWVEKDGVDVAIVTVPRSATPVWSNLANNKGGKQDKVLIRSGPRTLTLEGPELGEWIANRR